jgi:S1-C subfamily serine protease
MCRVVIACVVAILLGYSFDRAIAEFKNEDLERAIKATALVELPNGGGFGTAFCINSDGYFVTSRHIVNGIGIGGKLTLVLSPGGAGETAIEATVAKVAEKDDLALLRAPKAPKTPALELGDNSKLHETMSITAFGYPYGKLLGVEKQKYPNISVNVGRVTALRGERTAGSGATECVPRSALREGRAEL